MYLCMHLNVTQRLKTCPMSGFLFPHILPFIGFKILFTESKYLFSNWGYACLIKTVISEKIKNVWEYSGHQSIWQPRVDYFEMSLGNRGLPYTLYQINQTASKSYHYFTNYDKFTGNCRFENCIISRKRQVLSPGVTYWLEEKKSLKLAMRQPLVWSLSLDRLVFPLTACGRCTHRSWVG